MKKPVKLKAPPATPEDVARILKGITMNRLKENPMCYTFCEPSPPSEEQRTRLLQIMNERRGCTRKTS